MPMAADERPVLRRSLRLVRAGDQLIVDGGSRRVQLPIKRGSPVPGLLRCADGTRSVAEIAELSGRSVSELSDQYERLRAHGIVYYRRSAGPMGDVADLPAAHALERLSHVYGVQDPNLLWQRLAQTRVDLRLGAGTDALVAEDLRLLGCSISVDRGAPPDLVVMDEQSAGDLIEKMPEVPTVIVLHEGARTYISPAFTPRVGPCPRCFRRSVPRSPDGCDPAHGVRPAGTLTWVAVLTDRVLRWAGGSDRGASSREVTVVDHAVLSIDTRLLYGEPGCDCDAPATLSGAGIAARRVELLAAADPMGDDATRSEPDRAPSRVPVPANAAIPGVPCYRRRDSATPVVVEERRPGADDHFSGPLADLMDILHESVAGRRRNAAPDSTPAAGIAADADDALGSLQLYLIGRRVDSHGERLTVLKYCDADDALCEIGLSEAERQQMWEAVLEHCPDASAAIVGACAVAHLARQGSRAPRLGLLAAGADYARITSVAHAAGYRCCSLDVRASSFEAALRGEDDVRELLYVAGCVAV